MILYIPLNIYRVCFTDDNNMVATYISNYLKKCFEKYIDESIYIIISVVLKSWALLESIGINVTSGKKTTIFSDYIINHYLIILYINMIPDVK